MSRPRSEEAIEKLIEFQYFLGRWLSEKILKAHSHLKQTTVYQICKTLELWGCTLASTTSINNRVEHARWRNIWLTALVEVFGSTFKLLP